MGDSRGAYRILTGKAEGMRQLERPRGRWEDNIKMDFREVGLGHGLNRSGSGQGHVAGQDADFCECGNEPSGYIKYGKFLE
jgi:hypothetical protein